MKGAKKSKTIQVVVRMEAKNLRPLVRLKNFAFKFEVATAIKLAMIIASKKPLKR